MAGFFRSDKSTSGDLRSIYGGGAGVGDSVRNRPTPSYSTPLASQARVPVPSLGATAGGGASVSAPRAPPVPQRATPAMHSAELRQPHMFRIVKSPPTLNTTNCVILNPQEWGST